MKELLNITLFTENSIEDFVTLFIKDKMIPQITALFSVESVAAYKIMADDYNHGVRMAIMITGRHGEKIDHEKIINFAMNVIYTITNPSQTQLIPTLMQSL